MARKEDEVLYGGAAGGGKSDALIAEALRQVHIPHYRGIIFRKTLPQAQQLMERSFEIYKPAIPGAVFNKAKSCWSFPAGAKIYFGSMPSVSDRTKYQGKRFDYIAFDELTHFTWEEYSYLFSRNRAGGSGTRCYIRSATNPGGVGHGWVKERFISGKTPLKTYYEDIYVEGKRYRRSRAFVPSSVFDNKILMENNPEYVAALSQLPEGEKKALLYGDWDSFSGQVFTEFKTNPAHYMDHKFTHVIEPFNIPKHWRRYRSFDFGYSRPFSVGWWAVSPEGAVYRYRELYGCSGEPNCGVRWEPRRIARRIKEIEEAQERTASIVGIADPSIWDNSRGSDGSVINMMEREGIYFEKGDNNRFAGKMQLHYRLAFDPEGYAGLYVFNCCKHFIRTIPALVYDKYNIEDIDSSAEDHIYDETRYFLMANPMPPKKQAAYSKNQFNPLDL